MSNSSDGDAPSGCPLVIITWEDSRQPVPSWTRLTELPDGRPVQCATVGWLLRNGDDAKVIAQSMGDIDSEEHVQASGIMVIPARCVIKVEMLVEECASTTSSSTCDRDVA